MHGVQRGVASPVKEGKPAERRANERSTSHHIRLTYARHDYDWLRKLRRAGNSIGRFADRPCHRHGTRIFFREPDVLPPARAFG